MTPLEQLNLWVGGKSVHNQERNECVPDFSCCNVGVETLKENKIEFKNAYINGDDEKYMSMLWEFLSKAINMETDKKVYIAKGDM
jgi:outer membrane biogenesis lipoprotein LolB